MNLDETAASELWRQTLSQITSLFGRLVYLSSLRNANSGVYEHFGFSQRFTPREADRTMRRSHMNVFADWLCLSLEQQKSDVERYLAALPDNRTAVIEHWKTMPPFAGMIPAQARDEQRELFLADLRNVVRFLLP
ncbi:MAG: hypothetical protein M3Z09_18300 [Acidobacteriota bacterium]|nr:hypothetical protein [Acidobacteriota bacterium]